MYKEQYDRNEYVIAGVRSIDSFNAWVVTGLQIRGMFTMYYRRFFETSTPDGLPTPEQLVIDTEIKGVTEVSFNDNSGKKWAFKIKKLEDANWPHSYAHMDFGERFR